MQQIVYLGVASSVVHIGVVERAANYMAARGNGLDGPVLSAVQTVLFLRSHLYIVASVVSVSKRHLPVIGRHYAVNAVVIRPKERAFADGVLLGLVCLLGRMRGDKHKPAVGIGLQSPFLKLVAAILLSPLYAVGTHPERTVPERVHDTPRAGQAAHDKHLFGILFF